MRTYVSEGGGMGAGGNCGRSSHGPLRLCNGANLRRATNGANARNYGGTGTLGGSGGSPMSGSSYTTTSAKKNAKFPSVAYQYVWVYPGTICFAYHTEGNGTLASLQKELPLSSTYKKIISSPSLRRTLILSILFRCEWAPHKGSLNPLAPENWPGQSIPL